MKLDFERLGFMDSFDFEWHEAKLESNLAKHGLHFKIAHELFDGRPMLSTSVVRENVYRYCSVAVWRDRFVTTIWTWRGNTRRIISMRRARDAEKRAYRAIFSG